MKTDLKKVDKRRRIGFNWLLTNQADRCYENSNRTSDLIEGGELVCQLTD